LWFDRQECAVRAGAEKPVDFSDGLGGTDTLVQESAGNSSIENVYGSNKDDVITGDTDVNNLIGQNGNDTIDGGAGHDTLEGGNGGDTIVFGAPIDAANSDTVIGFNSGEDKISLKDSVFALTCDPGDGLSGSEFAAGSSAANPGDRVIYDSTTGNLYYDDDGSGSHAQVLIAHFDGNPTITAGDIVIG